MSAALKHAFPLRYIFTLPTVALASITNKISDKAINVKDKTERLSPETLRKDSTSFLPFGRSKTLLFMFLVSFYPVLFVIFQWLM